MRVAQGASPNMVFVRWNAKRLLECPGEMRLAQAGKLRGVPREICSSTLSDIRRAIRQNRKSYNKDDAASDG
jgi:hypothetical protein